MTTDRLLLAQISVDVRDVQKQMQRAGLAVDTASRRMSQTWRTNTSAMARDTEQFGRDVRRAIAAIGLTAAAGEVTSLADAWTRAGNQISAAAAATGTAGVSLSAIADIARDTRVEFEATATLYARLTRATGELGASQAQVIEATRLINQAFVAGGASAQEQASAILQLSQALSSGVLQGDELRSLRESSPLLLAAIAKEFGVAQGALKALGAEGKLTSDRIFSAILKAAPEITAQFSVTQATIGDSFTNLRTAAIEYVGQLNSSLGVTASFGKVVDTISENFEFFADALLIAVTLLGARGLGGALNTAAATGIEYARTMRERSRSVIEDYRREKEAALENASKAAQAVEIQKQALSDLEKERAKLRKTIEDRPRVFAQYGELKLATDELAKAEKAYNDVLSRKGATEAEISAALQNRNRAQAELIRLQEKAYASGKRLDAVDAEIANRTRELEKEQRRLAGAQTVAASAARNLERASNGLARAGQSLLNFFGGPIGLAVTAAAAAFSYFEYQAIKSDRAIRSMTTALEILSKANLENAALSDDAAAASAELAAQLQNQKDAAAALEAIERRRLRLDYMKGLKGAQEETKRLSSDVKILGERLEEAKIFGGDTSNLQKMFNEANQELADTTRYVDILQRGLAALEAIDFAPASVSPEIAAPAASGFDLGVSGENPLAGDLKNISTALDAQIKAAEDAKSANERTIQAIRDAWNGYYLDRDEQIKADLQADLAAINASAANAAEKAELRLKAEQNAAARSRELREEEMEYQAELTKAQEEATNRELDLLAQVENERDRMLGRFQTIAAREYEARRAYIEANIADEARRNAALAALADEEAEFKRLARQEALALDERGDDASQIEAVRDREEMKLAALQEAYELERITLQEHEDLKRAIIEDSEAEILAIRTASASALYNASSQLFGSLAGLARQFAGENSTIFKALFFAEKAFALASAYVNMQLAIAKANASAPPPLNAPAILAAKVTGAAAIAGIIASTAAGFKKGGYTGDGDPNSPAGVVHKGEFVVPAKAVKQLGRQNLESLRFGRMPSATIASALPAPAGRSVTFGDMILNVSGDGAAEIRDELAGMLAAHRAQIARDMDSGFSRTLAREMKTKTPRHMRDRP